MDQSIYDQYVAKSGLQNEASMQNLTPQMLQMLNSMQAGQAMLVSQTSPAQTVERIMLRIRGLQYNKMTGHYEKVATPKMNQCGIDNIWFILDSHINDSIRFGRLKEEVIFKMVLDIGRSLRKDLALNWREYGIQRKTDLDIIMDSVLFNIYAYLTRADSQNEKNWIGKMTMEHLVPKSNIPTPKKEGGFLNKFKL